LILHEAKWLILNYNQTMKTLKEKSLKVFLYGIEQKSDCRESLKNHDRTSYFHVDPIEDINQLVIISMPHCSVSPSIEPTA